jgi:hypothetical protein
MSLETPEQLTDEEIQQSLTKDYGWRFEPNMYTEAPTP